MEYKCCKRKPGGKDEIVAPMEALAREWDNAYPNWRCYYENIAGALAGTTELAVTAHSVRQTMVAIEAARLSAAEHRAVAASEIA